MLVVFRCYLYLCAMKLHAFSYLDLSLLSSQSVVFLMKNLSSDIYLAGRLITPLNRIYRTLFDVNEVTWLPLKHR